MDGLTLFDELLLALGALYAFECVAWPRWGSLVCATTAGFKRRPGQAAAFPSNEQGGAALTGALPTDVGFIGELAPIALSPEGLVGESPCHPHPLRRMPGTGATVRWQDAAGIHAMGGEVRAGKAVLAAGLSAETARRTAAFLRRLAAMPASSRERAIRRHFDRSLCDREASRRAKRWLKASLFQRTMAMCSFLFLFAAAPLGEHRFGLTHHWPLLAFLFLWWHLLAVTGTADLHREFFPALRGERVKRTLMALLAPSVAMRSGSLAAQGLMAGLHPLAVAAGTCRQDAWRPTFAFAWRDAHHPLPAQTTDPVGNRIVAWHRDAWKGALGTFAARHGLAPAALENPDGPPTQGVLARCPRCLTAFAKTGTTCTTCEGMATVPCGK